MFDSVDDVIEKFLPNVEAQITFSKMLLANIEDNEYLLLDSTKKKNDLYIAIILINHHFHVLDTEEKIKEKTKKYPLEILERLRILQNKVYNAEILTKDDLSILIEVLPKLLDFTFDSVRYVLDTKK